MNSPCVVFIGCDKSCAAKMALEILMHSVEESQKPVFVAIDELTEFNKEQLDYLIGKSKQLRQMELIPEPEANQREPEPRPNHSYKAVKERNKFFNR